jgi:uncharacterized protein (TIGR03437 family)
MNILEQSWVGRSLLLVLAAGAAQAQISTSAYRVLGQADLLQNGINMVLGVELYAPSDVAVDSRGGQVHIYISDTANSRVLGWPDARSYQIGAPPAIVLGQPGAQYSKPMGIGTKGFRSPLGLAVDPLTGNLYVADSANNRVLRFPSPFANPTRAEPDAVYGQPGFTTNTAGTTPSLMAGPRSVAVDSSGNLWVADTGNHRILRFGAASLNNPAPPSADVVIGQADFYSGAVNRGAAGVLTAKGFDTPVGITLDAQGNLYVADFNNTRVLKFSAPLGPGTPDPAATSVIGEPNFATRGTPAQPSNATLAGPTGVAVDSNGLLYVSVPGDNRVLTFSLSNISGGAQYVLGQGDFTTTTADFGVFPLASPNTLSGPADVKVDGNGYVYVADTGNNRVLMFPPGSKSAAAVWGQTTFTANGVNEIKPGSLNAPFAMAVDYSQAPYALYVSDTANNRILGWKDSTRFRNGDPADFVIGQADLRTAIANADSGGSLNPTRLCLSAPKGIAVQPNTGTLYVADSGNNRILRFPRPANQSGQIQPDAVIGQPDFTSSVSAVVSAFSLSSPGALSFGPDGDLFVADTGNNRVLEFSANAGSQASAVRVYGQAGFNSGTGSPQVSAQILSAPQGVFVDSAFNLYVADTGANRVVIFPNTQAAPPVGAAAAFVIGQSQFNTTGAGSGSGGLRAPVGVAADQSGTIYVSDTGNNRIVEFSSLVFLPIEGATAFAAIGQPNTSGSAADWDSLDGLATPDGLAAPTGIYLDRQNTLYVADAGNSRVLQFLGAVGVVNAATFQPSVAVPIGGLVSIFGADMTTGQAVASGAPWPGALLNRQVVINDQTVAPLYFASPTQINFQFPSAAPAGTDRIAVRTADTGELVSGGLVLAQSTAPGLFTLGAGQAAATNQDNTVNSSTNPAPIGSVITLYGTGQGQVNPQPADGTAAPAAPLATTVAVPTSDGKTCTTSQPSMCVAIGSAFGDVQYTGLAPGYVGLWQINVKVPQGIVTGGAVPVRVLINGVPSNIVTIGAR